MVKHESMALLREKKRLRSNPANDTLLVHPQVVLACMRSESSLLASRMVRARTFYEGSEFLSSAHELLHPQFVNSMVTALDLKPELLKEQGP